MSETKYKVGDMFIWDREGTGCKFLEVLLSRDVEHAYHHEEWWRAADYQITDRGVMGAPIHLLTEGEIDKMKHIGNISQILETQ